MNTKHVKLLLAGMVAFVVWAVPGYAQTVPRMTIISHLCWK